MNTIVLDIMNIRLIGTLRLPDRCDIYKYPVRKRRKVVKYPKVIKEPNEKFNQVIKCLY